MIELGEKFDHALTEFVIFLGLFLELSELLELDMQFGVVEESRAIFNLFGLFLKMLHFLQEIFLMRISLVDGTIEISMLFLQ